MNKPLCRLAGLILAAVMILGNTVTARAASRDFYVSATGSDSNPGTAAAPFKTFAKANSMLRPGSTLHIYAGIYTQPLKITKQGTVSEPITIQPLAGKVMIDLRYAKGPGIEVRSSYVTVNDIGVRNVRGVCVNLIGSNLMVNGLIVHHCSGHGIHTNQSSVIRILNSTVYNAALANASRTLASSWGSGIKVRLSRNILIRGNTVYNNHGEGIGTRGVNITVSENTVFDNYSVNIYTNSENALIEKNFVYCTPDSGFERGGLPATGIGLGEEYFEGWGARLVNARVINNIVAFCRHGVRYLGAEPGVVGGGLKNATIAYNTLYGSVQSALSIAYASAQSGSLIANNIIWQAGNRLAAVDNPAGLAFQYNLWKAAPPAALRGPGDQYGDPQFVESPGYTPESYRLSPSSPAAGAGADTGIPDDFYAQQRGPAFDMGAIQSTDASGTSARQDLTGALVASTAEPPATGSPAAPTEAPLPGPAAVPAETLYDSTSDLLVYSEGWVEEVSPYAVGGSFARTIVDGASVSFPFTGQSFSILYKGGPGYRSLEVYIDDALAATLDERHDTSTYKARWDYPGQLPPGEHTLKLVFVSTGSSTKGSLDSILVR